MCWDPNVCVIDYYYYQLGLVLDTHRTKCRYLTIRFIYIIVRTFGHGGFPFEWFGFSLAFRSSVFPCFVLCLLRWTGEP